MNMNVKEALPLLLEHNNLQKDQMTSVMMQIMTGETTPSLICAFLIALRMKGETVDEVAAAAEVMRSLAAKVETSYPGAVDIVGTGGDATSTFNVSTASALVAAAAGVRIAKHGARSVSSKSGAADLLECAGVNIELTPEQVSHCVEEVGLGFMFAPMHHRAMMHAVGPRREMGVRTLFNLLGPLTNPAAAKNQVLGVFDEHWVKPLAEVLLQLGSNHVMVVNGADGMDEISCTGRTQVAELRNGVVSEYTVHPEEFGLQSHSLEDLKVDGAEESLAVINGVLAGNPGAARDIVLLNAGAAIYVGSLAADLAEGVQKAAAVIDSGAGAATLAKLVATTQAVNAAS